MTVRITTKRWRRKKKLDKKTLQEAIERKMREILMRYMRNNLETKYRR